MSSAPASSKVSHRSGAVGFSGRASSGLFVARTNRRSACSWAGSLALAGTGSTATWTAQVQGVFRNVNFLATGLATDRVPEDDIVVVTVHFTKDNGELSSVTLDENTQLKRA